MKRLFSYSLVLLSLLFVVISADAFNSKLIKAEKIANSTHDTKATSSFSATGFPLNLAGNESVHIIVAAQTSTLRQNSQGFHFRIVQAHNLLRLKFHNSSFWFTTFQEQIQYSGYYLFHLCKMLI